MNNEFIVWDNEENAFYEVDTLIGTCNGYRVAKVKALKENTDYSCYGIIFDWDYSDNDEIFVPMGIKDINNKKIYADSSIVEFENEEGEEINGYFFFDKESLSYSICITSSNYYNGVIAHNNDFIFKIIDTIQENKLGLINE